VNSTRRKIFVISLVLALLTGWIAGPSTGAEPPNQAGLVVAFGDGSYVTRCVTFGEPSISGYEVLERSGLDIVTAEGMICDIEGTSGCSSDNCLCSSTSYWSYWHLINGGWMYSDVGSSAYQVSDGDVEGWRWGGGQAPPVVLFDDICSSSAEPHQTFLPIVLRQSRSP
jgi:hypothetical protein